MEAQPWAWNGVFIKKGKERLNVYLHIVIGFPLGEPWKIRYRGFPCQLGAKWDISSNGFQPWW